jgi:hypothetical protein
MRREGGCLPPNNSGTTSYFMYEETEAQNGRL